MNSSSTRRDSFGRRPVGKVCCNSIRRPVQCLTRSVPAFRLASQRFQARTRSTLRPPVASVGFDTATRKLTPFSDVRVDAMAVMQTALCMERPGHRAGNVLRFDFRGRAEIVAQIDGGAESLAIGSPDSLLAGVLLVGHQNEGRISVIDPLSLRQTVVAIERHRTC